MDKTTYIYRSKDPIKNFKIKVKLNKFGSILEKLKIFYNKDEFEKTKKVQNNDAEEYIFSWQEKVFSMVEIAKYTGENSFLNHYERKYQEDVKELKKTKSPRIKPHRLYTYVNNDAFTTNHTRDFKKDEKNKSKKKNQNASESKELSDAHSVSMGEQSSLNNIPHPHLPVTMFIMADLRPNVSLDRKDKKDKKNGAEKSTESLKSLETVLCKITYSKQGVLTLRPDFNRHNPPYIVTSEIDNELYEYTLEHLSEQMTHEQIEIERGIMDEYYKKKQEFLQNQIGFDFEEPNSKSLRLFCNIEIIAASDFEYNNLYISWFVHYAEGWQPKSIDSLYGCTHTCATRRDGNRRVAHFALPFSLHLEQIIGNTASIDCPCIFFEVTSFDSWERFRTEGYTYLTLDLEAGSQEYSLQCWRPIETSNEDKLRRFFVGNLLQLEDPSYVAVPLEHRGSCLNRFGFKTQSTGCIYIRKHTAIQSHESLKSKLKADTESLEKPRNALKWDIVNLLDAFKKSKMRMRRARESIQKELLVWK